jgi:hypothetical protein
MFMTYSTSYCLVTKLWMNEWMYVCMYHVCMYVCMYVCRFYEHLLTAVSGTAARKKYMNTTFNYLISFWGFLPMQSDGNLTFILQTGYFKRVTKYLLKHRKLRTQLYRLMWPFLSLRAINSNETTRWNITVTVCWNVMLCILEFYKHSKECQ